MTTARSWWWRTAVTLVLLILLVVVDPVSPLRELLWIALGTGVFVMAWDAFRNRSRRTVN